MTEKFKDNPARSPGAEFARARGEQQVPFGEVVEVEYVAASGVQHVAHGLRQRFESAVVAGQSLAGLYYTVATPQATIDAGVDPREKFIIHTATSHTGTVRVWVF